MNNVSIFLTAEFFRGFLFTYAIATLFYISIGINYTELSFLWLAMAITQTVFEIPFGILSDKIGHRNTILLGYFTFAFAILTIGLGQDLLLPLIGSAIWGVSGALLSGSTDAFLYDSLCEQGKEASYIKLKGIHSLMQSLGIILGAIPGAYLFKIYPRYPWYAQALMILIAFFLFFFSKSSPPSKNNKLKNNSYFSHFKTSWQFLIHHSSLLWLTAALTLCTFPLYGMSMIRQPFFLERGIKIEHLGYIFASIEITVGFTGVMAHKIEKQWGLVKSFFSSILLLMILFYILKYDSGYLSILPMALLYSCFRFNSIILNVHSNHQIPSEKRATILSIQSMGNSCLLIGFILTSGLILDLLGINTYLMVISIYISICFLALMLTRRSISSLS